MVSADFPGVDSTQREAIYKCLKEKKWNKVVEFGRDITTIWYAFFVAEASESGAIAVAKSDFDKCSEPYCKPKLVIHFGENKPTFHGLK